MYGLFAARRWFLFRWNCLTFSRRTCRIKNKPTTYNVLHCRNSRCKDEIFWKFVRSVIALYIVFATLNRILLKFHYGWSWQCPLKHLPHHSRAFTLATVIGRVFRTVSILIPSYYYFVPLSLKITLGIHLIYNVLRYLVSSSLLSFKH